MMTLFPNLFCGLASFALLLDAVQPYPGSAFDSAGRLTLDGVLAAGVIVLWRALEKKDKEKDDQIERKDAQVLAMATKVTETMTLVTTAVTELRTTVAGLRSDRSYGIDRP